jgi:hypothetical protein
MSLKLRPLFNNQRILPSLNTKRKNVFTVHGVVVGAILSGYSVVSLGACAGTGVCLC